MTNLRNRIVRYRFQIVQEQTALKAEIERLNLALALLIEDVKLLKGGKPDE